MICIKCFLFSCGDRWKDSGGNAGKIGIGKKEEQEHQSSQSCKCRRTMRLLPGKCRGESPCGGKGAQAIRGHVGWESAPASGQVRWWMVAPWEWSAENSGKREGQRGIICYVKNFGFYPVGSHWRVLSRGNNHIVNLKNVLVVMTMLICLIVVIHKVYKYQNTK